MTLRELVNTGCPITGMVALGVKPVNAENRMALRLNLLVKARMAPEIAAGIMEGGRKMAVSAEATFAFGPVMGGAN